MKNKNLYNILMNEITNNDDYTKLFAYSPLLYAICSYMQKDDIDHELFLVQTLLKLVRDKKNER